MELSQLVALGIQYGLWMSVFLGLLFVGLAVIKPAAWVNDYPPAIREKFGPMDEDALRLRKLSGIPFALILIGAFLLAMLELARLSDGNIRFLDAWVVAFTMLLVFNLVDLLIIDWLFFVTLQPKMIILPGTEGMAEYKDYMFHLQALGKGIVGSAAGSLLVALVAWLLSALIA